MEPQLHSMSLSNSNGNQNVMTYQLIISDKEFLLRAALTFDWNSLIQFCDLLLEILNDGAASPTFNETRCSSFTSSLEDPTNSKVSDDIYGANLHGRRSRRHYKYTEAAKEQLLRKDQWGNNALHAACYNSSPLRVIIALLRCASSAGISNYLTSLSRDLSTPLNIACATGSSTDVIRVLLNPPRGIEPGGLAATIPDARGCTPLSELVIHYELQRKSPSYFAGRRPSPSLDNVNLHNDNNIRNLEDPFFESFWIKVDMIIRAAWSVSSSNDTYSKRNDGNEVGQYLHHHPRPWISILHGAANIADSCPISLISLICRSHPTMINADTVNDGTASLMPLHLAILASCCDNNHYQLVKQKTRFIKELIEKCPQAVQKPFPHSNGRSLFCQAISVGLSWNLLTKNATPTLSKTIDGSDTATISTETKGPLAYIWDHVNPEVLIESDITTGLVPFLLAATSTSTHTTQTRTRSKQNNDDDDILRLDTIFELLRLHPQVLGDMINGH